MFNFNIYLQNNDQIVVWIYQSHLWPISKQAGSLNPPALQLFEKKAKIEEKAV